MTPFPAFLLKLTRRATALQRTHFCWCANVGPPLSTGNNGPHLCFMNTVAFCGSGSDNGSGSLALASSMGDGADTSTVGSANSRCRTVDTRSSNWSDPRTIAAKADKSDMATGTNTRLVRLATLSSEPFKPQRV